MIFHENRLLADDSHVISNLIFVEIGINVTKFHLSSAAVLIGALRVKVQNFQNPDLEIQILKLAGCLQK